MKKCPKCGKTYDDSWGVCINDNTKLQELKTSEQAPAPLSQEQKTADKSDKKEKRFTRREWILMTIAFYIAALVSTILKSEGIANMEQLAFHMGGAMGYALTALLSTFLINLVLKEKMISVLVGFAIICYLVDGGYMYLKARKQGLSPVEAKRANNLYSVGITSLSFGLYWILTKIFKSKTLKNE